MQGHELGAERGEGEVTNDMPRGRTSHAIAPSRAVAHAQHVVAHEHGVDSRSTAEGQVLPDGSGPGTGDRSGLAAGEGLSDHDRTSLGPSSFLGVECWDFPVDTWDDDCLRRARERFGEKGQVVTRPRVASAYWGSQGTLRWVCEKDGVVDPFYTVEQAFCRCGEQMVRKYVSHDDTGE